MNFNYENKHLNENELEWILIFWRCWFLQLFMFTTKSALILRFGLLLILSETTRWSHLLIWVDWGEEVVEVADREGHFGAQRKYHLIDKVQEVKM